MTLTSDEQKRRQSALWRAHGMSEDEIARRLTLMDSASNEVAASKEGSPSRGSPQTKAQGSRPSPGMVPFDRLSQPYRFIALPNEVLPPEHDFVAFNEPLPNGYCATLTVEWIAETPLLIGGAAKPKKKGDLVVTEPLAIGNRYLLPGATLRGLIRNAVEIVAHGKMTQGNWHYRFGLRDFVHPYYKGEAGVSKVKDVRAGMLRIRADKWELTPAKNWGHVEVASLAQAGVSADDLRDGYNNKKGESVAHKQWIEKDLKSKYSALGMVSGGQIEFAKEYTFRLVREDGDRKIYVVDPNGSARGIMLVSGRLPGGGNKRYEYFVSSDLNAKPIELAPEVVELFERLYSEPAKGDALRPTGSWKDLKSVAEKDSIPVFYVGDPDPKKQDPRFFFGLTRLFKVPHKLSVGGILHGSQPAHRARGEAVTGGEGFIYKNPDFVETLFGYVVEPRDLTFDTDQLVAPGAVARKGRVAFGFAWLDEKTPAKPIDAPVQVIQMAPRASFAPFYLRGEIKDYSGGKPQLAGRKAYFPCYRRPANDEALANFRTFGQRQKDLVEAASRRPASADVFSHLRFLTPAAGERLRFFGDIRLHNVTAAEIGAVLYAITHGGDREKRFRHMIGRGKPFGAGQMRIGRLLLRVEANKADSDNRIQPARDDERFDKATGKGWVDEEGCSLRPFLTAFETYLCETLNLRQAKDSPAIGEWLGMADPEEGAKLANEDRLFYHPFAKDRRGRDVSPFQAYKLLREGTQAMETRDRPQGSDRLLAAPQAKKIPD